MVLLRESGRNKVNLSTLINMNLVTADWHGNNLGLEGSSKIGYFDLSGDSLVGFHVEALDSVSSVDLSDELRMEGNNDGGGDEDSSGVEGAGSGDVAAVERKFDSSYLASILVGTASFLVE